MTRITPLEEQAAPEASRDLAAAHLAAGGRMTNMKWTLARAPAALEALLQWYPLYDQVVALIAFGAMMIATNVFNDALGVPLDGDLEPYR